MNMHFYEGAYIKFDLESAKRHIGDDEILSKLTLIKNSNHRGMCISCAFKTRYNRSNSKQAFMDHSISNTLHVP